MSAARRITYIAVPLATGFLIVLLAAAGVFQPVTGWLFDALLRVKSEPNGAKEILLIDIDDAAQAAAGPWPWTRDILAKGLITLKEMDARTVVLDVPLARKSLPSFDPAALRNTFPAALDHEFTQIEQNIQTLFDAIRRGSVKPQDSPRYISDLIGLVAMSKLRLVDAATGIARDDDTLLGQAIGFSADAFVPLDLLSSPDPEADQTGAEAEAQRFLLSLVVPGLDTSPLARAVRLPVSAVSHGARGGGFSDAAADADGVRRRALLVSRFADKHVGQIAFAALLDFLGNPVVQMNPASISLRDVTLPGKASANVTIPLDGSGRMLVDWPSAGDVGFRRISWGELAKAGSLEATLLSAFKEMDRHGYLSYLRSDAGILDAYEQGAGIEAGMLSAGDASNVDAWREARARFFSLADQFLSGDAEERIVRDADKALLSATLSVDEKKAAQTEREMVSVLFSNARQTFRELEQERTLLGQAVRGSLCIVSLGAAAAPSRVTLTPFGARANDGSASAAVASTILSGKFVREARFASVILLAIVLSLACALAASRMRPLATFVLGVGIACAAAASLGALFTLGGVFLDPVVPAASGAFACLSLSFFKLFSRQHDNRKLRGAFAGRVSAENLKALLAGPATLALKGERRSITCLFASVKGFPTTYGSRGPVEIVETVQAYHAAVGEVILSLGGTLERGRADSVSAYFGAPLDMADHVGRACRAALRMKVVEKEMNLGASPPIAARIGVETGECIAGDLGSRRSALYSVVGPATDMAARLESLNARYASSILVSERVFTLVGGELVLRRLDKVRLAGTSTSFRVYELIAERGEASARMLEAVEVFSEALSRFEEKDWRNAQALFSRVLALAPGDGPANAFLERCREHTASPGSPTSFPC
jgi:adenylate cyclase